jgi:hypothetical protein
VTIQAWLKSSIGLTLAYCLAIIVLGQPLVWTFDPTGEGAVFAGLILGSIAVFLPTWFFLALPRRIGMTLFGLQSLSPWMWLIHQPVPTRILSGFILWSLLELPMYGLELLGLLEAPNESLRPRRPARVPTSLLLWAAALLVAYAICYVYRNATPITRYPPAIWAIASLFVPLPPLIAAAQFARRVLRRGSSSKLSGAIAG